MKQEQRIWIFAIVLLASVSVAIAATCCTNPDAMSDIVCMAGGITEQECCGGKQACIEQYWYPDTSCYYIEDCQQGCCCNGIEAYFPDVVSKAQCSGENLYFFNNTEECETRCADYFQCINGIKDINEEGIDCGGNCPEQDCCDNGFKDLNEEAIDCGGVCDECQSVPDDECLSDMPPAGLLSGFNITPVKGERKLMLGWGDSCDNILYSIQRCEGAGCTLKDIALVAESPYTDDYNLEWGKAYTYKITALSKRGWTKSTEMIVKMGDVECDGNYGTEPFCISVPFYYRFENYLKNHDYPPCWSKGTLDDGSINACFNQSMHRANGAFFCGSANNLSEAIIKDTNPPIHMCGPDYVCVVREDNYNSLEPICLERTSCEDFTRPFGFFYDSNSGSYYNQKEQCEVGYCYYDRSATTVDKCHECKADMSCYDYKSQDACVSDSCSLRSCVWKPIEDDINSGICINERKDNCYLCNKKSVALDDVSIYNNIFDICTQEKSDALETTEATCFFKADSQQALSCKEVSCRDYKTEQKCLQDNCGIGVCQWFAGSFGCVKNADNNNYPDCFDAGNLSCTLDYFIPETLFAPVVNKGIYEGIIVSVKDKKNALDTYHNAPANQYLTYICISHSEDDECASAGYPFSLSFTPTSTNSRPHLLINGLRVYSAGNNIFNFTNGTNTIRYYSVDPANNVGEIKEISIIAYSNTTHPLAYAFMEDTYLDSNGVYRTNNTKPRMPINFTEPAQIIFAQVKDSINRTFLSTYSPTVYSSRAELMLSDTLPAGTYNLRFNARNKENAELQQDSVLRFIVETKPLSAIAFPDDFYLVNKSTVLFNFSFNRKAKFSSFFIGEENLTSAFISDYKDNYSVELELSDGLKKAEYKAYDYLGNELSGNLDFIVDSEPVHIDILEPSFGISSIQDFRVKFFTENIAECRYFYSLVGAIPPSPTIDNFYSAYTAFDSTDDYEHTIGSFDKIDDYNNHSFYIICNDSLYNSFVIQRFVLRIDDVAPKMEVLPHANGIYEYPLETFVSLETDKDTICRYDGQNIDFENMKHDFNDSYGKLHSGTVRVDGLAATYSYYAACQGKNNLSTGTKRFDFDVDLSKGLEYNVENSNFTGTGNIILSVSTNKNTICNLGANAMQLDQFLGIENFTKLHFRQVSGLQKGINHFYAQCYTRGQAERTDIINLSTFYDDSAPLFVYVNDSIMGSYDPDIALDADSLDIKFLAEDEESGIAYYEYMLIMVDPEQKVILNWTKENRQEEWISVTDLNLSQTGAYTFLVRATNKANLSNEEYSDGVYVDIGEIGLVRFYLIEPSFGISSDEVFDVVINTNDSMECRYWYSEHNSSPPQLTNPGNFETYYDFDNSGGREHYLEGFMLEDSYDHPFYIACNDTIHNNTFATEEFIFSIDDIVPEIINITATDAYDEPISSDVTVWTDKETLCKYDPDEYYFEDMQFEFDQGYGTLHSTEIEEDDEQPYSYNVVCKAKNDLETEVGTIEFDVDFSIDLDYSVVSSNYTGKSTAELQVLTNKHTICNWGITSNNIISGFEETAFTKLHTTEITGLQAGSNDIYFQCYTAGQDEITDIINTKIIYDNSPPELIYINDSVIGADDPDISPVNDSLSLRFLAMDEESGIAYYDYALIQISPGIKTIFNWTRTYTPEPINVTGLDLEDEGIFIFSVKATNKANLSSEDVSDGVIVIIPRSGALQFGIQAPSFGISSEQIFDIIIRTNDSVDCRYWYSSIGSPAPSLANTQNFYDNYGAFDQTDGQQHILYGFDEINDNLTHKFTVVCNDSIHNRTFASQEFSLRIDDIAPEILIGPNATDVNDEPMISYVSLQTDRDVICRYDDTYVGFDEMQFEFDQGYGTLHSTEIEEDEEGSYTYYAACEAKNSLTTATAEFNFDIDFGADLAYSIESSNYTGATSTELKVRTNKHTYCNYGTSVNVLDKVLGEDGFEKYHTVSLNGLNQGNNNYYFRCYTKSHAEDTGVINHSIFYDHKNPAMLYVDDTIYNSSNPNATARNDSLAARWNATDNETGIAYYRYEIIDKKTQDIVLDWTQTNRNNVTVSGLSLAHLGIYSFVVEAYDYGGRASSQMQSDGVLVNVSLNRSHCSNSILDYFESDIDCGGDCDACENNKACVSDYDCISVYCFNSTCKEATCSDSIKNQDESDIDCGGICSGCNENKTCVNDSDCNSYLCGTDGLCHGEDVCSNAKFDPEFETDIDCGDACEDCALGGSCDSGSDCITGYCFNNTICRSPSCSDNVWNQDESDIDCGGNCTACSENMSCRIKDDCLSGICSEYRKCIGDSYCDNGLFDLEFESDIDCGGDCDPCSTGKNCTFDDDCASGQCSDDGKCIAPTNCDNNVFDQSTETDIDCGGSCGPCENGKSCNIDSDCESDFCFNDTICKEATCDDEIQNQDESDVDCGGGCESCDEGKQCYVDEDCTTGYCGDEGSCKDISFCSNGVYDSGLESDIDCGGECLERCQQDQGCGGDIDCMASLTCGDGKCVDETYASGNQIDGPEIVEKKKGVFDILLTILLVCIVFALVAVGGFFGFRYWNGHKNSNGMPTSGPELQPMKQQKQLAKQKPRPKPEPSRKIRKQEAIGELEKMNKSKDSIERLKTLPHNKIKKKEVLGKDKMSELKELTKKQARHKPSKDPVKELSSMNKIKENINDVFKQLDNVNRARKKR